MPKLSNKVAVVAGGNSGIGLATAKRFASEGATVVITGRRKLAVEEAAASIEGATAIVADAASLADTARIVEQIMNERRVDTTTVAASHPVCARAVVA